LYKFFEKIVLQKLKSLSYLAISFYFSQILMQTEEVFKVIEKTFNILTLAAVT